MVTQPAYLKNLKTYARQMFGDEAILEAMVTDLSLESDRGAVILAATGVEDALTAVLQSKMEPLKSDDSALQRTFENNGPLSSFSAKVIISYALGMIDKQLSKEIDLIREIRNACAHSRRPLSFENEVLQAPARIVIGHGLLGNLKDEKPQTIRVGFIVSCALIQRHILTGKRQDALEAFIDAVGGEDEAMILFKEAAERESSQRK